MRSLLANNELFLKRLMAELGDAGVSASRDDVYSALVYHDFNREQIKDPALAARVVEAKDAMLRREADVGRKRREVAEAVADMDFVNLKLLCERYGLAYKRVKSAAESSPDYFILYLHRLLFEEELLHV